MIKYLYETHPWKVEHRSDGSSFMGVPYQEKNEIKYFWTVGPMDKRVVEFLEKAIQNQQKN